jgi:hypothetical protein
MDGIFLPIKLLTPIITYTLPNLHIYSCHKTVIYFVNVQRNENSLEREGRETHCSSKDVFGSPRDLFKIVGALRPAERRAI